MEYPTLETHFAPTKLLLPLFIISRNRIRLNRFWEVHFYIHKKVRSYASCIEDEENVILNSDDAKKVEVNIRPLKFGRSADKEKSFKLAPNRYNVPREVGISKKGMKGAYWSQSKRTPMGGKHSVLKTAFYDIPRDSEKFDKRCFCYKGRFLTDPRKRRPTSRFMVSNLFTCWRNPKDPGPSHYFKSIFDREMFAKLKRKPPIPFKFLRFSCVPEIKTFSNKKISSFDPGAGRYELGDDEDEYLVRLQIERQKRLKFRRLPFRRMQIREKKHAPKWRHVSGFGCKRLFKGPLLHPAVVVSKKKIRKADREIHLFPSFEYIQMINNPIRKAMSLRTHPITIKSKPMRYNCVVRVIIRRQLRNNKKIAFNSGTPRFPDADTMPSKKTARPPRLVDHPVMRVPVSEIKSKLHALPKRLMGIFKENRIRPFKFQPFPPIKLLLDDNEVHPEHAQNIEIYPRQLNPLDFFKDEFKRH